MILEKLVLENFRNIESERINFSPQVNVFYGENGQGKTNLLEAVHFLSTLRSFRTSRKRDLISFGADSFRLDGIVESAGCHERSTVFLGPEGRKVLRNGKIPAKSSEFFDILQVVPFSPADSDLTGGDAKSRRAFIDRAAYLIDPFHLILVREFERALHQRNSLLKTAGGGLEVWDEEVAVAGAKLYTARRRAAGEIRSHLLELHAELSGRQSEVEIALPGEAGNVKEQTFSLLKKLEENRKIDKERGFTTAGPHRQVVVLSLSGKDVKNHGSQGQRKTLALALKLSLLKLGEQVRGEEPVFLLDDPGSELDEHRRSFLGTFLSSWRGQVMIACVDRDHIPTIGEKTRFFKVFQGAFNSAD